MSAEPPFSFHIRRDNPYDPIVTVRFEVREGKGFLGLRVAGRADPEPDLSGDEKDIAGDTLRGGRFVHVLSGGNRQSYALSRVTQEVIDALPDARWITLDAVTEYGFRYLQAPPDLAGTSQPPSLQQIRGVGEQFGAMANLLKAPRSTSLHGSVEAPPDSLQGAQVSQGSSADVAPRQVPIAPALAEAALAGLTLPQATELLKIEMAKVEALHVHASNVERELAASRAREADLIELLARWQSR